jgi:hypothetical protein
MQTGAGWVKKPDCVWVEKGFRRDNQLNIVKTNAEFCRRDNGESIRSGRYVNAETGESVP